MAENDVPDGSPTAAPAVAPQSPWVVLFALFGAALIAYNWASACPAKPLATFLEDQARGMGGLVFIFALPGALVGRPLRALRELLVIVPLYLVGQVPSVASMTREWEGGWIPGLAGAAAGAAAGMAMGQLFTRWTLPELEKRPREHVLFALPIVFAVLFAIFGAYNWGVAWATKDDFWVIVIGWVLLALPGALVGRPFLGLLVMSPFLLVTLIPFVGSMTVGWEGGWLLGSAGAAVGALAGAAKGWMFKRWIMPLYDKLRARENGGPGRQARPTDQERASR